MMFATQANLIVFPSVSRKMSRPIEWQSAKCLVSTIYFYTFTLCLFSQRKQQVTHRLFFFFVFFLTQSCQHIKIIPF